MHRFTLASPLGSERGQTGPAGQRSKVKGQRARVKGEVRVLNVVVVGRIFRCGAVVATPFIAPGLTRQWLCPALPLISSTPTRQRRALGAPARQSRGPHRARLRGGVESPRLVRPSVFLARSARLARDAVAQRVQNSRVWPHNGLRPGLRTLRYVRSRELGSVSFANRDKRFSASIFSDRSTCARAMVRCSASIVRSYVARSTGNGVPSLPPCAKAKRAGSRVLAGVP